MHKYSEGRAGGACRHWCVPVRGIQNQPAEVVTRGIGPGGLLHADACKMLVQSGGGGWLTRREGLVQTEAGQ